MSAYKKVSSSGRPGLASVHGGRDGVWWLWWVVPMVLVWWVFPSLGVRLRGGGVLSVLLFRDRGGEKEGMSHSTTTATTEKAMRGKKNM